MALGPTYEQRPFTLSESRDSPKSTTAVASRGTAFPWAATLHVLLQVLTWVLLLASLISGEAGTWLLGWPRNPLTPFFGALGVGTAVHALHKVGRTWAPWAG